MSLSIDLLIGAFTRLGDIRPLCILRIISDLAMVTVVEKMVDLIEIDFVSRR